MLLGIPAFFLWWNAGGQPVAPVEELDHSGNFFFKVRSARVLVDGLRLSTPSTLVRSRIESTTFVPTSPRLSTIIALGSVTVQTATTAWPRVSALQTFSRLGIPIARTTSTISLRVPRGFELQTQLGRVRVDIGFDLIDLDDEDILFLLEIL